MSNKDLHQLLEESQAEVRRLKEREQKWLNLDMLQRRHSTKLLRSLKTALNGNEQGWAQSAKTTGLEQDILKFQTELGCAPTCLKTMPLDVMDYGRGIPDSGDIV